MTDVETSVKYGTVVETMAEAWRFCLAHVDEFARPRIVITPIWGDDAAFEAVISGITTKGNE